MKNELKNNIYLPALDGLRFLAIAGVLIFHIVNYLYLNHPNHFFQTFIKNNILDISKYGRFGVELFFIISGIIIPRSIEKHNKKERIKLLKIFYIRRIFRIFPPYFIIISCSLIFNLFLFNSINIENGINSYISSIFFIHNMVYPGQFPFLCGAAWSLEIEMQYYLLAPILFLIIYKKPKRLIFTLKIFFFLLFFIFNNIGYQPVVKSILSYAHFFILGEILFSIKFQGNFQEKHFYFSLLSLISSYIFIYILKLNYKDNLLLILFYKLIILLIIFTGIFYILYMNNLKILIIKIFAKIGTISYSIYLIHYPIIIIFGRYILTLTNDINFYFAFALNVIIFLTVILFFSYAFFIVVERPLKLLLLDSIKISK